MKHISDPKAANVNIPAQTPNGKLYLHHNLDVPHGGAPVLVPMDEIGPDFTDGIEDVVNFNIKPGVLGWYLVIGKVCWESAEADIRYDLSLTLNPGGVHRLFDSQVSCTSGLGTGGHFHCKVVDVIKITNVNQYFELNVVNNDLTHHSTIINGLDYTFMTVQRVR